MIFKRVHRSGKPLTLNPSRKALMAGPTMQTSVVTPGHEELGLMRPLVMNLTNTSDKIDFNQ
jgi:hypothetical protein